MKRLILLVLAIAVFALPVVPAFSSSGKAQNGTASLVHVGLNPSTCQAITGTDSGVVNVHLNAVQDQFGVNVSVHDALPNTTYVVDIRCQRQIGSLTTNSEGTGTAHIDMTAS